MLPSTMRAPAQPADERQHLTTPIRMSSEGIFVIDLNGTILDANDAALVFLGRGSLDDLLGQNFVDFLLPEDRSATWANVQKRLAGEQIENQELEFMLATDDPPPIGRGDAGRCPPGSYQQSRNENGISTAL